MPTRSDCISYHVLALRSLRMGIFNVPTQTELSDFVGS
jgi:hypothetical protein